MGAGGLVLPVASGVARPWVQQQQQQQAEPRRSESSHAPRPRTSGEGGEGKGPAERKPRERREEGGRAGGVGLGLENRCESGAHVDSERVKERCPAISGCVCACVRESAGRASVSGSSDPFPHPHAVRSQGMLRPSPRRRSAVIRPGAPDEAGADRPEVREGKVGAERGARRGRLARVKARRGKPP